MPRPKSSDGEILSRRRILALPPSYLNSSAPVGRPAKIHSVFCFLKSGERVSIGALLN